MPKGEILYFDTNRYYGHIKPEDNGENIFCHGSHVLLPQGETLGTGDRVEYDEALDKRNPEKMRAINVRLLRRASSGARYLRSDMMAENSGRGRHRAAAEALLGPVRQMDVSRGD